MHELLADYPVVIRCEVRWGEMDAFQHVNNTVYFRYFENIRMAYLLEIGFSEPQEHGGTGPILAFTSCRFRFPLTFPDVALVGCRTTEIRPDRFFMDMIILSEKHDRLAAQGQAEMVAFNYDQGKKASLPAPVVSRIKQIEKQVPAERY